MHVVHDMIRYVRRLMPSGYKAGGCSGRVYLPRGRIHHPPRRVSTLYLFTHKVSILSTRACMARSRGDFALVVCMTLVPCLVCLLS